MCRGGHFYQIVCIKKRRLYMFYNSPVCHIQKKVF